MVEVVLMCGPAGSGKSVHARRLASRGYALLSVDALAWQLGHRTHPLTSQAREEVHADLRERLRSHIKTGASVVVDSSFWSRASRDEYRRFLATLAIVPVVHFVETPRDVILQRLARRTHHGPDDIAVPARLAAAYVDGFEPPTEDEGPLVYVSGE